METQVTTLSVYFSVPGPEAALAEVFRLAGDEKRGRVGTKQYTPRGAYRTQCPIHMKCCVK